MKLREQVYYMSLLTILRKLLQSPSINQELVKVNFLKKMSLSKKDILKTLKITITASELWRIGVKRGKKRKK